MSTPIHCEVVLAKEQNSFGENVRVVLASAEFSREITSSVIWLNAQGLDIRCVRLRPYKLDDRVLLDVQQIIPLPEAAEYQVLIREKKEQQRAARDYMVDFTRYDLRIGGNTFSGLWKKTTDLEGSQGSDSPRSNA